VRSAFAGAFVASLLGVTGVAAAQGAEASTVYEFVDEPVTGGRGDRPLEILLVRTRGERANLIDIRPHFVPEMLKSVEVL
jgi:hypothetical protein